MLFIQNSYTLFGACGGSWMLCWKSIHSVSKRSFDFNFSSSSRLVPESSLDQVGTFPWKSTHSWSRISLDCNRPAIARLLLPCCSFGQERLRLLEGPNALDGDKECIVGDEPVSRTGMFNFGGSGGFGFFDEAATVEYNSSWTILSFGDVGLSIDGIKQHLSLFRLMIVSF